MAKGGKATVSRLEAFRKAEEEGEDRPELTFPPLDAAEHLVEYLLQIGPMQAGEVLTFQEIESWSRLTGYAVTSWEAITLRRLSAVYGAEYSAASDPQRGAPYLPAAPTEGRPALSGMWAALEKMEAQDARGA